MRALMLAATIGLTCAALPAAPPALAQGATDPLTGARAGHVPGVGVSLPRSDHMGHTAGAPSRAGVAPTLPQPGLGEDSGPYDYLRAARAAITAGRTGEAQQSLEMAQTRSLDRSVAPGQSIAATDSPFIGQIRAALGALATGDRTRAIALIDVALAS
jgi:hypothetical protein